MRAYVANRPGWASSRAARVSWSLSPQPPSRLTTVLTPAAFISARYFLTVSGVSRCLPPPRWLCMSTTGNRGVSTMVVLVTIMDRGSQSRSFSSLMSPAGGSAAIAGIAATAIIKRDRPYMMRLLRGTLIVPKVLHHGGEVQKTQEVEWEKRRCDDGYHQINQLSIRFQLGARRLPRR